MPRPEPQITEIASYLAGAMPVEGSEREESVQAWRQTLRYAREAGFIEPLADMIHADSDGDVVAQAYAEQLRT